MNIVMKNENWHSIAGFAQQALMDSLINPGEFLLKLMADSAEQWSYNFTILAQNFRVSSSYQNLFLA